MGRINQRNAEGKRNMAVAFSIIFFLSCIEYALFIKVGQGWR
jgi:hypothetical protein